jgi:DNA-binding NtrC family response regulator
MTLRDSLNASAAQYLRELLTQTSGNLSAASRIAGLSRATLYRRCARHQIALRPERTQPLCSIPSLRAWPRPAALTGVSP